MKITKFNNTIKEAMELIEVPEYLYHATYKQLLPSIKQNGLGGETRKNWEDSAAGMVYLAHNPEQAESYAETSDMVPEEWLDEIVVLKIGTKGIDHSLLSVDDQNLAGDTIQYNGIIPSEYISVW